MADCPGRNAGKGLIDDGGLWRVGCIGICEIAAGENRDAKVWKKSEPTVFCGPCPVHRRVGWFVSIDLGGAVVVGPAGTGRFSARLTDSTPGSARRRERRC